MDNFNFDDMDGFGTQDDSSSLDFGASIDDNDIFGNTSDAGSIPDNAFDGAFDNNSNEFSDSENDNGDTKKKAIILIIVGVLALIIVVLLATTLPKALNKDTQLDNINTEQVVNNQNSNCISGDASSIMNTTISNTGTTASNNSNSSSNKEWTVITDSEDVTFYENPQIVMFTITDIKHYAKVVDDSGMLIMKTTLTGTLAGYPGTYTIDIPYSKGQRLTKGTYFNVSVQVGDFKGTTVIGDISTYITEG